MTQDIKSTVIFTDGASRGNPGPGGWGTVIVDQEQGHVTELGGAEKHTTNNKMELMAAIRGLLHVAKDSSITLYTDSSYVINGITKWIQGWKRNDWKTKTKEEVMNKDLWMELDEAVQGKQVIWKYVGGHVGIAGNERCDEIATASADGVDPELYDGPLSGYPIKNILNISYDSNLVSKKDSSSSRSRAKAYSYVSFVGGKIEIHKTWAECEKRVKGVRGTRYKKALDAADEQAIVAEFR